MIKIIIFILVVFASSAFGQGAHYTYPFTIICPDGIITEGGSAAITTEFEYGNTGDKYKPTYNWSVSVGTITSGQGTPTITVEVGSQDNGLLTVTLERDFAESHFPDVQRSSSCSVVIRSLPQPNMIDEFRTGSNNCEDGFARLDSFFTELSNNPVDEGLIVIYGDTRDLKAGDRRAKQLSNHFSFRKFDRSRVRFIRGEAKDNGTTQFWLVPPGAKLPEIAAETERAGEATRPTQSYLYAAEYSDGIPGCSGNLYDLAEYAKVLQTDPTSTGRIVIGQSSQTRYQRKVRETVTELTRQGVTRTRIVTVYKYVRPNRAQEMTELWIVPPKRGARVSWIDTNGVELIHRCPATVQSWLRAC